jgi:hypothetical protein
MVESIVTLYTGLTSSNFPMLLLICEHNLNRNMYYSVVNYNCMLYLLLIESNKTVTVDCQRGQSDYNNRVITKPKYL